MGKPKKKQSELDKLVVPGLGHRPHRGGAGKHDARPRGQRDRAGVERAALRDQRESS